MPGSQAIRQSSKMCSNAGLYRIPAQAEKSDPDKRRRLALNKT